MGYHTDFAGALKFTRKLTARQLAYLKQILRQDCREHPEWNTPNLTYVDLALLPDNSGIQWDGSEKTYHMPELVNVLIRQMRKTFPEFGLSGAMTAQGSDVGDLWELYISADGFARKRKLLVIAEKMIKSAGSNSNSL